MAIERRFGRIDEPSARLQLMTASRASFWAIFDHPRTPGKVLLGLVQVKTGHAVVVFAESIVFIVANVLIFIMLQLWDVPTEKIKTT